MLSDTVRTLAYERALQVVVQPHHRVLDFGCGTGILSFFAHRAGAARIFAVDRSPLIQAAREVARDNGFDRIEFSFQEDVTLDSAVDVIVSEWMGHFVFNESMLEPLLQVRDRYLRPEGTMIPRSLSFFAGIVIDPGFMARYEYFRNRPYGIDFSALSASSFARTETRNLKPEQVANTIIPLGELDMLTCSGTPETLVGAAVFAEPVTAHGLIGWFDVNLAEGVSFGTGPFSPRTHWSQMGFPLRRPFAIEAGEPVRICIEPTFIEDDRRHWRWSLEQGTREMGEDELASKTWLQNPPAPGRLP
jgi:protein arginine N-methyltransferase 1